MQAFLAIFCFRTTVIVRYMLPAALFQYFTITQTSCVVESMHTEQIPHIACTDNKGNDYVKSGVCDIMCTNITAP